MPSGDKKTDPESRTCNIKPTIREYAIENQAFVVSANSYLDPQKIPNDLRCEMTYNPAIGGSCIVNPAGLYVREPDFN